jgi:uncharacterized protein YaeQ
LALSATVFSFDITLSDTDRHVYEQLSLKVARHPSETDEHLWTRVIAYALEYTEGIAFSKGGLSDTEEPAITIRDLTGSLRGWIEIGAPSADRLHKASKASPRVVLYTQKDPRILLRGYEGAKVHRAESIAVWAVDQELLEGLSARLDRRMVLGLSVSGGELYFDFAGEVVHGVVVRHSLPQ